MIEQTSHAVKFLAFFTEDRVGKTGLTVTADVRGHNGAEIVTAAAATEIGDGLYSYTLAGASTANVGTYIAIFKTATETVDMKHIPSLWCIGVADVDNLARIGSGQITTVTPVAQSGDVTIVQGDDYLAVDGRAIDWTDVDAGWPDLTGATIAVEINGTSYPGSVVTATGPGKVRLQLTDTQTALMSSGARRFGVTATDADGHVITLLTGTWLVNLSTD